MLTYMRSEKGEQTTVNILPTREGPLLVTGFLWPDTRIWEGTLSVCVKLLVTLHFEDVIAPTNARKCTYKPCCACGGTRAPAGRLGPKRSAHFCAVPVLSVLQHSAHGRPVSTFSRFDLRFTLLPCVLKESALILVKMLSSGSGGGVS